MAKSKGFALVNLVPIDGSADLIRVLARGRAEVYALSGIGGRTMSSARE